MIMASDFKRGLRIEIDGDPYQVVDYSTQSPSARGGATLVKAKIRNIKSGQLFDRTFKTSDKFKEPDFEIRPSQYLYDEGGDTYYFMDMENYEQFPLKKNDIEYELGFIRPNDEVRALVFNGHCIGIEISQTVTLEVVETEPGIKGDTVNNVTKPAKLETGIEVQVPLFVEQGSQIVVDTRDARYLRRA